MTKRPWAIVISTVLSFANKLVYLEKKAVLVTAFLWYN